MVALEAPEGKARQVAHMPMPRQQLNNIWKTSLSLELEFAVDHCF